MYREHTSSLTCGQDDVCGFGEFRRLREYQGSGERFGGPHPRLRSVDEALDRCRSYETIDVGVDLILAARLLQVPDDILPDFVEGLRASRLLVFEEDDVEPELSPNHIAQLAGLE